MATLGSQAVGSIVKLNVNGTARNWIVVHQGLPGSMYDASCDGTWLLMEDLYESRAFDSSDNDYANSDIHSYLNNTFVNLFDSDIKSAIKQVKIPYRAGSGSSTTVTSGSSGLSAKVFLLSYTEVGFSGSSTAPVEGAVLSYFNGAANSKRVAKLNGTATDWFLRSPVINETAMAYRVHTTGSSYPINVASSKGVRPALVLPTNMGVASNGNITLKSGAIAGQVNIGGVLRDLTGEGYVNVGGTLYPLSLCNININGVLMESTGQGLTFVDYIATTGMQYIDTGFAPNQDTRVVIDMDVTSSTAIRALFGARKGASANAFYVFAVDDDDGYQNGYSNNAYTLHPDMDSSGRHVIDKNKNLLTVDGTLISTQTYSAFTCAHSIYLMSINNAGTSMVSNFPTSGKIYSCQIYDNGTLVRDFAPCINAEGGVGLYDKVNSKFYGNAGTGSFTTP